MRQSRNQGKMIQSIIPLQRARSLSSSHPNPPAPTTRTRAVERGEEGGRPPPVKAADGARGSNSPIGSAPVSLANGDSRLRRVCSVPRAEAAGQGAPISAWPFIGVPLLWQGKKKVKRSGSEYHSTPSGSRGGRDREVQGMTH